MHVTKKHALIYHAWYNYPQISSQDYEVLAAYSSYFFALNRCYKNNLVILSHFFSFFVAMQKKEKKPDGKKRKKHAIKLLLIRASPRTPFYRFVILNLFDFFCRRLVFRAKCPYGLLWFLLIKLLSSIVS